MGNITIKILRDVILDKKLTRDDAIALHNQNWDDIVIEHRKTYGEPIKVPFLLLGVLIREDYYKKARLDNVMFIRNDEEAMNLQSALPLPDHGYDFSNEIAYRCRHCGNIVDFDGAPLSEEMWFRKKTYLETSGNSSEVVAVNGYCHKNGPDL